MEKLPILYEYDPVYERGLDRTGNALENLISKLHSVTTDSKTEMNRDFYYSHRHEEIIRMRTSDKVLQVYLISVTYQ